MLMQTLTPTQEALLDVHAYPWWPDLWTFGNLLAAQSKGEPPDTSALSGTGGAEGILQQYSAAELLRAPLLARGAGLQLKRDALLDHST